jgi:hypothetical protein
MPQAPHYAGRIPPLTRMISTGTTPARPSIGRHVGAGLQGGTVAEGARSSGAAHTTPLAPWKYHRAERSRCPLILAQVHWFSTPGTSRVQPGGIGTKPQDAEGAGMLRSRFARVVGIGCPSVDRGSTCRGAYRYGQRRQASRRTAAASSMAALPWSMMPHIEKKPWIWPSKRRTSARTPAARSRAA